MLERIPTPTPGVKPEETTAVVMRKLEELKIAENKDYYEVERKETFTKVYLHPKEKVDALKPRKIVCFDLDDTMVTVKGAEVLEEAILRKIMESPEDVLVVCITSRKEPHREPLQLHRDRQSALSRVRMVDKTRFAMIIFTSATSKESPMDHLYDFYAPRSAEVGITLDKRQDMCLVDDRNETTQFTFIPALAGRDNMSFVLKFIAGSLSTDPMFRAHLKTFKVRTAYFLAMDEEVKAIVEKAQQKKKKNAKPPKPVREIKSLQFAPSLDDIPPLFLPPPAKR